MRISGKGLMKQALANEARIARKPLSPVELVGAMQDRMHKEVGKVRIPHVARSKTPERSQTL